MPKVYHFNGGINSKKQWRLQQLLSKMPPVLDNASILTASLPQKVVLTLSQRQGGYVKPLVKLGDKVLTGQTIASSDDPMHSPVHSSISGKVVDISACAKNPISGIDEPAIVIASDGRDKWIEQRGCGKDFQACSSIEMTDYIKNCGIVGLGGAGFPTHIKLARLNKCQTLIINGVECEPGISCDDAIIQNHPQELLEGIKILQHIAQAEQTIIAVKANNSAQINLLEQLLANSDIKLAKMEDKYAAGDEKVIINSVLKKHITSDKHSIDIGVLCQNVGTTRAIYDAVINNQPLISRIISISGDDINHTQNYQIRLGANIADIPEISAHIRPQQQYFLGGLMMGAKVSHLNYAIAKTLNSIFINKKAAKPKIQSCIRCGTCHQACPIGLLPQQIYWYAKSDDIQKALDHNLLDCTLCGCCTAVCPSNIPLADYFNKSQTLHHIQQAQKRQADIAKDRFEFREFRLKRNKAEKKALMAKKKAEIQKKLAADKNKQNKIQAALERAQHKSKNPPSPPVNND